MKTLEKELTSIYSDVFYFTVSRVDDVEQARDITQSVMETVIAKRDTLRNKNSFKSWVLQITKNKINAYYNGIRRYNHMFMNTKIVQCDGVECLDIDIEEIKFDILQKLIDEEDQMNIMIALGRIDKKYQEVIRLNIICEYNLIETAEIMNVNVNTVRTWSARGLVKLREEFEKLDLGE